MGWNYPNHTYQRPEAQEQGCGTRSVAGADAGAAAAHLFLRVNSRQNSFPNGKFSLN